MNHISDAIDISTRIAKQCTPESPALNNVHIINSRTKPKILATCQSFEQKLHILKQKRNLKGINGESIFVNDDLTPEDSQTQFHLRQEAAKLRKENKTVQIRGNRLRVEDEWWQWSEATRQLERVEKWAPKLKESVGDGNGTSQ